MQGHQSVGEIKKSKIL